MVKKISEFRADELGIDILYENVFQNPEFFRTQVSLSPEQSTLVSLLHPYAQAIM
jgi:hypothetical protein